MKGRPNSGASDRILVVLILVQVFHAGSAVLVQPGNWAAHVNYGHLIGLPIVLLALFSLTGRMPVRFLVLSLLLYLLYALQYVFLHLPVRVGAPALAALHPTNALVIFATAFSAARTSWQFVRAGWQSDASVSAGR